MPYQLRTSILLSLRKTGSQAVCDKYLEISMVNKVSKMFSLVLNEAECAH